MLSQTDISWLFFIQFYGARLHTEHQSRCPNKSEIELQRLSIFRRFSSLTRVFTLPMINVKFLLFWHLLHCNNWHSSINASTLKPTRYCGIYAISMLCITNEKNHVVRSLVSFCCGILFQMLNFLIKHSLKI